MPPTTSTRPSSSSVAVLLVRVIGGVAAANQRLPTGSYSSAWALTTSTRASLRTVAVWLSRASAIGGPGTQTPVGSAAPLAIDIVRNAASARATLSGHPVRISPASTLVAVGRYSPDLMHAAPGR